MDVGSADIASLHECNLLGQRICTGRTVVGLRRSSYRGAIAEEQISVFHVGLTVASLLQTILNTGTPFHSSQ